MYCGPIDDLMKRELRGTETHREISVYPTRPKVSVPEIQRISKLFSTTSNLGTDSVVQILLNTYLNANELRSLAETLNKWQKSPPLMCEMILVSLKKIERDSNWTVVFGNFYCQCAASNDLSVFACLNDRNLAILRGSWISGTVAPVSAGCASKQLMRRKGFDFSRDPSMTHELERMVEKFQANTAPEVCAEISGLLTKDDGSLEFLTVCGGDFCVSLEKNIENRAIAFFGELPGMSLLILRLM